MSPLWTTFDCRRRVLAFGLVRARTGALPAGIGRAGPGRGARRDGGGVLERGQDSPDRLCLHRVRGRQPALGRPLPGLWRPGTAWSRRSWSGRPRPGRPARWRPRSRSPRSPPRPAPTAPPGSRSSTGSWAAASSPGRSCCWPASPASASRPCCCGCWPAWPSRGRCCTSAPRSRASRSACGPSASGPLHPGLLLAAETDLGAVRTLVEQVKPTVVVVDSVQTVADPELAGAAGGVGQVREVRRPAGPRLAKERSIATFLVGQVTKDGAVAGPQASRAPGRHGPSTSRATSTTPCAWCAAPRTASAPPTRSAASR